jgi:excisionase family DNA binding protein
MKNDILTPAELASEYKTTKPTVLSWFHKGIIPAAVSSGRVIRFHRIEVAQALAAASANRRDAR